MQSNLYRYAGWVWMAVGLIWLAGALTAKPATRRQSARSRLWHGALAALAFSLMFSRELRIGPLAWRVLPPWPAIAWTGLVLTVAGCAFAVWARLLLAGNWSATVTIKEDHRLVRKGPYTLVRHPIYFGGLLGFLGTALILGEVGSLLAVVLLFVAWLLKSRVEEAFLTGQFGASYTRYQQEVKALIPFVL
jgi:protein-S-isoprenylcysteine O-methyltransferase Ste14